MWSIVSFFLFGGVGAAVESPVVDNPAVVISLTQTDIRLEPVLVTAVEWIDRRIVLFGQEFEDVAVRSTGGLSWSIRNAFTIQSSRIDDVWVGDCVNVTVSIADVVQLGQRDAVRVVSRLPPRKIVERRSFDVCSEKKVALPLVDVGACVYVRNRAPVLREWLTWHKRVGIERVFLLNGQSDDALFDAIAPFSEMVTVHNVSYQNVDHDMTALHQCVSRFGASAQWLVALDVDTYLVEPIDTTALDCDAIVVPWYVFSDRIDDEKRQNATFVVDRFVFRAADAMVGEVTMVPRYDGKHSYVARTGTPLFRSDAVTGLTREREPIMAKGKRRCETTTLRARHYGMRTLTGVLPKLQQRLWTRWSAMEDDLEGRNTNPKKSKDQ